MVFEQIAFGSVIAASGLAAYTDWKTGYIYDWITYPLIGIGIILTILTQQWIGALFAVLIYGVGLFAYNSGKVGGGDIKLLIGIALVQPVYQGMIFVLAILLVGALTACAVLCIQYVGSYLLTKPKIDWNTNRKKTAGIFFLATLVYGVYSHNLGVIRPELNIALIAAMILGALFYAFEEEVKKHSFLQRIPLNQLEDDEVLAAEHLTEEEKKRFGKKVPGIIGTEDVLKLTHMGFQTMPVYRRLPKFAPFLLMGVGLTYLFPRTLIGIVPAVF